MNQSVKAALLSALIFPGVGQITSGHKKRGWIIVSLNIALIYFIVLEVIEKAHMLIAEMNENGSAINSDAVSDVTSRLSGFSDNIYLNILLILLIISWFVSVYDAYRMAMKKDN